MFVHLYILFYLKSVNVCICTRFRYTYLNVYYASLQVGISNILKAQLCPMWHTHVHTAICFRCALCLTSYDTHVLCSITL